MHRNRTQRRPLRLTLTTLAVTGLLAAAAPAWATNGYFPHGYGMKALGMGGASTASTQDAYGGATNPASMVWVGSRLDLGLNAFSPKRSAERSGAGVASLNGKIESGNTLFWIPEMGYNRMLGNEMSLGVTVYGNGGMNTTYPQGSFQCPVSATAMAPGNILCGGGELGVDLMQLVVAPTFAMKLSADHSVGASLLLGYQQFKAQGLQMFATMSSSAADVSNNGTASSSGIGLRVGYMGRLSNTLTFGAAYATKVNMSKFDKYKGLFAGGGDFDIPANVNLGVSFNPAPDWTIAVDAQRIFYSGVAAVGNASSLPNPLGSTNGPGFGWKDIDVLKLGVSWRMSDNLTLRAGYNHGGNPVEASNVTFNIVAPGVMTDHYTAGFTYHLDKDNELSGAFMLAPRQSVTGSSMFNALMGPGAGGNETVGMKQTSIGLGWSRKF